jgi:photosystem II stability/assembly factor-like uncharacterized protein
MQFLRLALFAAAAATAASQSLPISPVQAPQVWQMQDSGSTASLRGIDSVDGKVAWASGTGGTVLKTTDGGAHWQQCAIPDGDKDGATLDFRGVQAWDAQTAIVMASGPGDKSRLYKTTDGCKSWNLLVKNEDKDGFWDALRMWTPTDGFLAGDPVDGHPFLTEFTSYNGLMIDNTLYDLKARAGEGAFAASNSSISLAPFRTQDGAAREVWFAIGGASGSRVVHYQHYNGGEPERCATSISDVGTFRRAANAGIFSIDFKSDGRGMVVGGDYTKPNDSAGAAASSSDGGKTWTASTTPPHGYRSTVQWSESQKLWITAGPNGSDLSRDDGKTWQPLDNGNWNALSLPFIVGPKGRIARLNPAALPKP